MSRGKQNILQEPLYYGESERAVLGAVLLNPDCMMEVVDILGQDERVFCHPPHRFIYRRMLDVFRDGKPIDIVVLGNRLEQHGELVDAGGGIYLAELTEAVPTSSNAAFYAGHVAEAFKRRRLSALGKRMVEDSCAKDVPLSEILEEVGGDVFGLSSDGTEKHLVAVGDVIGEAVADVERLVAAGDSVTGVPSGIGRLDELTTGFQPGDFVVIAARPSVGKTALALNILAAGAKAGYPGLFVSLEMGYGQLVQRLVALLGRADMQKMRKGFMAEAEKGKFMRGAEILKGLRIHILDEPNVGLVKLTATARRYRQQHNIGFLIVDYMQLMETVKRETRNVEIGEVSRGLKLLARSLGIPVIALSQLSREADKGGVPKLSHLRESGSIEQDADVVMLLGAGQGDGMQRDKLVLDLAKQRNGPQGYLELFFEKSTQFIGPMADSSENGAGYQPQYARAMQSAKPGVQLNAGFDDFPEYEDDDEVF